MSGRRNIYTLCEELANNLHTEKHTGIPVELIANKFSIDEKWIEKNESKFEFMRNETFDFCIEGIQDILKNAAPEKSGNLIFWIGILIGMGVVFALKVSGWVNF